VYKVRVRRWAIVLAAAFCVSAASAQAVAPPPTTTPEYNALFKRMFNDPTNVSLTFQFAERATKIGDYEGAIGALERILYFNPNLTRVKLQLGALYFKLGAYEMARSYFSQAQETGPGDVQAEAGQFLAELDRRLSPNRWSVFAQTGLRYQSNANFGPDGPTVRSLGQNAIVNNQFTKLPDWNWFGQFGVNYSYDLKHGNEDAVEATAFVYDAQQFKEHQFDFGLIEVQAGPRFSLPMQGASAKVYAIGTTSTLANDLYFAGGGAGVSLRFFVNSAALAWVEPAIEYRYRTFYNSTDFPTSSQQTGGLITIAARGAGNITKDVQWFGRVAFDQNSTTNPEFDFNSYGRWSADFGIPISFTVPWNETPHQIVVTPTAGVGYVDYAAADALVDPATVRLDREWRVGALVDVQIYGNYGIRSQVFYTRTDSNLPNYDMHDLAISVGPTFRF
jgi:tetratricopeptide (TPR) repeat protein